MTKILFVCHGNICRSPMAEFVMKDMAKKQNADVDVESAATTDEEIGNDIHYGTRRKLREMGVPFSKRRARQMTRDDYDRFDYLIGMDKYNVADMIRIAGGDPKEKIHFLLDFTGQRGVDVDDPWYTGDFDAAYFDIERGCRALLDRILSGRD